MGNLIAPEVACLEYPHCCRPYSDRILRNVWRQTRFHTVWTQSGPSACLPGYPRLRSGSRRLWRERPIEQHLLAGTERLGQRCRDERSLRIHITGGIVVERRGRISLQLRVGASYLGMVAQIVTKQKAALPPGMVSLQNMEVVCPWPGKSLPEEKLAWQPGLVLRHVSITQRLKRPDAA